MTSPSKLWIVPAVLMLVSTSALAQPGITASLAGALNTIGEPGADAGRRNTVAGSVEAGHSMKDGRLRLFYEFDGGTFTTEGDWRYYHHTAGATVRLPFGGDESKNAVFITGTGAWRANGTSWAAADYRAVGLMANVELHPRDTATVRAGYRLDGRTFPDLSELDQVQHDGFASLLVNFKSRTTLIGEAHVGAKSYAATVDSAWTELPAPEGTTTQGGMGRGMGPGLRGTRMASVSPSRVSANTAGSITVFGRIAQSLSDRTGSWLQYSQRATYGRVPPVVVTTPALFFDDGVYDDPFASDARVITAAVKHQFASGVTLEADFARMLKDYTGALALDSAGTPRAGDPLREDRIWRSSAGLTLPVLPSKTGALDVSLDFTYFFTRHRSNDAFYNYTSNGIATGLVVAY